MTIDADYIRAVALGAKTPHATVKGLGCDYVVVDTEPGNSMPYALLILRAGAAPQISRYVRTIQHGKRAAEMLADMNRGLAEISARRRK